MNLLLKFLTSRFSGWLSIVAVVAALGLGGATTTLVWKYKDLQVRAARCETQKQTAEEIANLQSLVIADIASTARDAKNELEKLKTIPGCASESPPSNVFDSLRDTPDYN